MSPDICWASAIQVSKISDDAIALVAIIIELIGVISVGTLSIVDPEAFPRATVWSWYGIGYGFVPLVLPIFGLAWLWRTRPMAAPEPAEGR